MRAGLVRATGEVADWVAAQVELGELDASRAALAEAEVRALRAQISPHFIYNSLNAIASFINTDPAQARELVLEFADFTRYSFRRHGDFTTVAEELRVDRQLPAARARPLRRPAEGDAADRSRGAVDRRARSSRSSRSSRTPCGTASSRRRAAAASRSPRPTPGAFAEISVEDDGVGIDPDVLETVLAGGAPGEHVGLRNVDARLRQVYGDEHGLVVETNVGAGTLVRMRVPKSQPGRVAASADAARGPDGRLERMTITVLIADDEQPAIDELAFLLGQDPRIGVIHQAASGAEAIRLLTREPRRRRVPRHPHARTHRVRPRPRDARASSAGPPSCS